MRNDKHSQGQDDEATWILKNSEKEIIQDWVAEQGKLKPKERQLPRINGKPLEKIFLAKRCYVINKPVEKVLDLAKNAEWIEGKGSWIKDKEIHNRLHQWQKKHDKPEQALKDNPPRMKAAKGEGNIIKSVRVAYKFGKNSIRKVSDTRIYKLGSNHHMEIFTNGKEGKERKLQSRIVTMLEAAERKSKKRSIINKEPNPEWGEGLQFPNESCSK